MTEKKKTYVAIVLDKSASMGSRRTQAIKDFNEQIQEMKKRASEDTSLETYVSLVLFDSQAAVVYENVPVADIRSLEENEYVPSGMTALYDAIGLAISVIDPMVQNPTDAGLVVVITDGAENSSKEENYMRVPSKIKELETSGGWTFTYLGASQSLTDFTRLGAKKGNTLIGLSSIGTTATKDACTEYFKERSRGTRAMDDLYIPKDKDDGKHS